LAIPDVGKVVVWILSRRLRLTLTTIAFKAIDSSVMYNAEPAERVDQADHVIMNGKIIDIQTTLAATKRNTRYPKAKRSILTLRVACWTV
jgi:hypothetical protein